MAETLLQAGHHGLAGDRAELVGEGAVEDQDVHGEDPLADGCGVLEREALVHEEDAAWEEKGEGASRRRELLGRFGEKRDLR